MSFGLTAFSQSSFSALGIITQLAEANLSVEATVTGTAGAVTPASAVVVSSGSVGDSTVDAVTNVVVSVTGTATSSSTAIGVANATTSATGEATSTSTARAIANLQATSPAVDSTVVIAGELQEDINSVAITGASVVTATALSVANSSTDGIIGSSTVTPVSVILRNSGNATLVVGATVVGTGLRNQFFDTNSIDYRRVIHINAESSKSRVVHVPADDTRIIYIPQALERTIRIAA